MELAGRGGGRRAPGDALRPRRPGHGRGRRRGPGHAGPRRRVPRPRRPRRHRAGPRPAASPRSSRPPTTPCSPRPGWPMGERVLVSGAAGGVGTAGVQLAAAAGAIVAATVRDRVTARRGGGAGGVDRAGARTTRPTPLPTTWCSSWWGRPACPGRAAGHLATGGRVAVIGVGGGAQVELDLLSLMATRARIGGSTLRGRDRRREGRRGCGHGGATSCPPWRRGACASRSARRSPCPRRRPPTTASPRAPSSARSSSSPAEGAARAVPGPSGKDGASSGTRRRGEGCTYRSGPGTSSTGPPPSTGSAPAIVDEPEQPAAPLEGLTYARVDELARAQAAALDAMGVGAGERVAVVSPNSRPLPGLLLRGERLRPGAGAGQLPAHARGGRLHRRALRCRGAAGRPRVRRGRWPAWRAKHRIVLDGAEDAELFAPAPAGPSPRRGTPTRTPPLRINYTSGTTARPKGVQLTHRNCWLNATVFGWHTGGQRPGRAPAHPADVPLQRLGHALRGDRDGRPPRRAAQGRRRGDPPPRGGSTASRCCAARRPSWPRCSTPPRPAGRGEPVPGARTGCGSSWPGRRRRRRPSSGSRPSSGWEFIQIYGLTETSPAAHHQPGAGRVGRPRAGRAGRAGSSRAGVPAVGVQHRASTTTARSWPARTTCSRATGSSPRRPARALGDGWFHTGDGGLPRRTRYLGHQRPQEGRHHHRRGERLVHRGRGLPLPAPGRGRGGGHRRARREVGRDHQGAGGAPTGPPRPTEAELIELLPGPRWRTSRRRPPSSSATSCPAPPPASCRSSSCASPTGTGGTVRSTEGAAHASTSSRASNSQ